MKQYLCYVLVLHLHSYHLIELLSFALSLESEYNYFNKIISFCATITLYFADKKIKLN